MINISNWKTQPTKIAVPITGIDYDEINQQVSNIKINQSDIDLIEWRVDYLSNLYDLDALVKCNQLILTTKMPVILTFRSQNEGGNKRKVNYFETLNKMIDHLSFDILDVEIDKNKYNVQAIIKKAHEKNIFVIASHHDLNGKLNKSDIIAKFNLMDEYKADIAKVAIMPKTEMDTLQLMEASVVAKNNLSIPIVSMSMGNKGTISRIATNNFGSCISFGSLGKSSAPGQLNVKNLKKILDILNY